MVKISIIVPVYNVEIYLKQCLDSLINQTVKDIEIICINDGSTDQSLLILQDYAEKDNRVTVIDKHNEGQSVARNIGIEMATGEYLGFVDSDDWVDLNYFEKLYDAAVRNNCDMACAGFKKYRKHRTSVKKQYEKEVIAATINDKVRLDNLPEDNYIWNKIYKSTIFKKSKITFHPGRFFEDLASVLKILHKMGAMVAVPGVYYYYRKNPNSTVATFSEKHYSDHHWAVQELFKYASENSISLDFSKFLCEKKVIKFLGVSLFKIYCYEKYKKYVFFGCISFRKKQAGSYFEDIMHL